MQLEHRVYPQDFSSLFAAESNCASSNRRIARPLVVVALASRTWEGPASLLAMEFENASWSIRTSWLWKYVEGAGGRCLLSMMELILFIDSSSCLRRTLMRLNKNSSELGLVISFVTSEYYQNCLYLRGGQRRGDIFLALLKIEAMPTSSPPKPSGARVSRNASF